MSDAVGGRPARQSDPTGGSCSPRRRFPPGRRRPADWLFAVLAAALVAFAGWASSSTLELDQRVLTWFRGMPAWVDVLASIGSFAGGADMVGLVVAVVAIGRGRLIVRDLVVAIVLLAVTVAVDARYLQQLGVSTTVALAQGPLISFGGFLVEVAILLPAPWQVGQEREMDALVGDSLG